MHNFLQLNGENYFDDDGILDELIENERRARRRRSRNYDANSNSEKNRNAVKLYPDKNVLYMQNVNSRETVLFCVQYI